MAIMETVIRDAGVHADMLISLSQSNASREANGDFHNNIIWIGRFPLVVLILLIYVKSRSQNLLIGC